MADEPTLEQLEELYTLSLQLKERGNVELRQGNRPEAAALYRQGITAAQQVMSAKAPPELQQHTAQNLALLHSNLAQCLFLGKVKDAIFTSPLL